jgi:hypothetical protein
MRPQNDPIWASQLEIAEETSTAQIGGDACGY